MQGFNGKARILGLAMAAGMFGAPAQAGELQPLEEIPSVVTLGLENSCATYGDFVACSTAVLNFVANDKKLFSINASQGFIAKDSVIAVYTNAGEGENSNAQAPINPTVLGDVVMDNAYTTVTGNTTGGFSTNKSFTNAEFNEGVRAEDDPDTDGDTIDNNDFAGDHIDYWDIKITDLVDALTKGSFLRDPVFVFDNNQKGETDLPDLKLWGLLAVRDLFDTKVGNPDLVFEFRGCDADTGAVDAQNKPVSDPVGCRDQQPSVLNPNNNSTATKPGDFDTDKVFGVDGSDNPLIDQYAAVQRQFCVDTNDNFNEVPCPTGNKTGIAKFDQNLGTGEAEFFGYLPELTGANLKKLLSDGYDTLSIDLRFFDQTNGFEDLFILAMGRENTTIPEPGSLALLGMAAIGFAATRRRKQAAARG